MEAPEGREDPMTSERRILAETLCAVTAMPETMARRNNTGQAWQGRRVEGRVGSAVRLEPGMVILRNARPVRFGLEGSGDIIGATHRRPLAVETKTDSGAQRDVQIMFERAWVKAGGIYILARSAEEACEKIEQALLIG
jgi:hypothetical protein